MANNIQYIHNKNGKTTFIKQLICEDMGCVGFITKEDAV